MFCMSIESCWARKGERELEVSVECTGVDVINAFFLCNKKRINIQREWDIKKYHCKFFFNFYLFRFFLLFIYLFMIVLYFYV